MKYKLIEIVRGRYIYSDVIITVEEVPNWFSKLLGQKPTQSKYIGSSTVWRSYPEGRRQSTNMERLLSDFWAGDQIKWKETLLV